MIMTRGKSLGCVLHGGNPVHHEENVVALCMKERPRIEAACRHAFASRPSERIDLQRTSPRAYSRATFARESKVSR